MFKRIELKKTNEALEYHAANLPLGNIDHQGGIEFVGGRLESKVENVGVVLITGTSRQQEGARKIEGKQSQNKLVFVSLYSPRPKRS